ncbi:leucine-rich repeat-containing G-protein coupled receptor 4 isoform X2 [Octopus bimaculoides]|uniref:Fibronectin type-III domain-containing protein n=1 Tax=Octopus bimaculoides TaxID=37653 RepID=A0A0L8GY24_OCTBM|nr:leucine-rich repeat-containing G-protein coupled receptor 4 isoform X2 [Octopus bimaculoides]XP_052823746.1 leucine-rich repeat-containing G-protein coupled receptor 4 isoform X2 [Octopus bimaculoides]XP_052823747.1 leucine-rich repeat-containing G-protein coupled receptor 4 isoform X2 [Octopus bimaculoides]XP_052823748.1 leucine-rich repeat-containing G-protein coupled receptor 4 isoform X2 [Octopus bimaculoides]XP_052823750.1 leucine-rich repeat-containing G-protein coupled receptor 4 isof|eukprot:XP_014777022.1 PREDICTED: leucine-rich repeat-containing G-protein coupled receptor 4-like [Octopus bimaculoides]
MFKYAYRTLDYGHAGASRSKVVANQINSSIYFSQVKWKKMMKVLLWIPDTVIIVLLFILFPCNNHTQATTCPLLCECLQDYYVYCDDQGITPDMLKRMAEKIPRQVRYIDLSQNKLDTVPTEIFEHFSKVHHLNLAVNQIKELTPGLFSNLTSLIKLNLQANLLSQLKSNLLRGLSELEELHLECNYIETISNDSFSGLLNLKRIYLFKNNVGKIYQNSFRGLQSLHILDASNNAIFQISDYSFLDLRHLTTLQLNSNQIDSIAMFTFAGLDKLEELFLDGNRISELKPESLSTFGKSLRILSLNDNEISSIEPNTFTKLPKLRKLFLNANLLSEFQLETFKGVDNLREIHVCKNKFEYLPKNILMGANHIYYADFSDNLISSINTDAFANFRESVRYLFLQNNRLKELHAGMFRRMVYLRELNVSENRVSVIKENVFQTLRNLRILNLSGNKLTHITPSDLIGAKSLEKLYLHSNPVESFHGFRFSKQESLRFVTMNLTLSDISPFSMTISWPYKGGTQIYWTMTGICLNRSSSCAFREQSTYFPAFKTSIYIDKLQPSSLYYVCVNPVFLSSHAQVIQCLHVRTPINSYKPFVQTTAAQVVNFSPTRITLSFVTYLLIIFIIYSS